MLKAIHLAKLAVIIHAIGFVHSAYASVEQAQSLSELLALVPKERATLDIAHVNLLCAQGLNGADDLEIEKSLKTIDKWANWVRHETDRHLYMYKQNPMRFRYMEGFFRMQMLVTVLQQDLNIQYNPDRVASPENPESGETFFADSKDLFIHGFTDRISPMGTCTSMPVLYAAIGRRLGYPLKLVHANQHCFLRWDGPEGERFNIEGTNQGMKSHPDKHYETWPFPLTQEQLESGDYLVSLSPEEEFESFLATRAVCQTVNKNYFELKKTLEQMITINPRSEKYRAYLNGTIKLINENS